MILANYICLLYMPYILKKVRGKKCWQVKNKYTKKIFAKCSTEKNAKSQLRLLRAIEFNKSFKLKPKGSRKTLRRRR
jgi:hypothetical protein